MSGKPGNVMEFKRSPGNVRELETSHGRVREKSCHGKLLISNFEFGAVSVFRKVSWVFACCKDFPAC